MNPRTSAQDVLRCSNCQLAAVQMYCNTCYINLCKACVGEHISAKLSKSHNIIDFKNRKSPVNFPSCSSHLNTKCEMFCNDCDVPICLSCAASERHKAHTLSLVQDAIETKKKAIEKDRNELNDVILPSYEAITSDECHRMTQLEEEYDRISEAIAEHGDIWHKEIDKRVGKLQSEINSLKNKHTNVIQKYISEFNEMLRRVRETLQQCDLLLACKDLELCFEYKSMNMEFRHSPSKPYIRVPIFTPQKVLPDTLDQVFGNLSGISMKRENQDCGMALEQKPQEAGSFSLAQLKLPLSGFFSLGKLKQYETKTSSSDSQLLDVAENVYSVNTGYKELYNLVCLNRDEIWTSGESSIIKLFQVNQNFDLRKVFSSKWDPLLKSIKTKSGNRPHDITVTKTGFLAYSDEYDRTVNILHNEKIDELMRFHDWRPLQICSTLSGELLVMLKSNDNKQSKIVRYYGSKPKQTIQFDEYGVPLYSEGSHYRYMTENKNMDICVADWRARVVVVVNAAGKLRFRYRGHEPAPNYKLFEPRGLTSDSQCRILTADDGNQCVHIIDQDGQFLRFIKCHLDNPRCLCTDTNDNLYVAQSQSNQVMKIKYQR